MTLHPAAKAQIAGLVSQGGPSLKERFAYARQHDLRNQPRQAKPVPMLKTPQERLLELEGIMNNNIDRYFEDGCADEYARLEAQLGRKS